MHDRMRFRWGEKEEEAKEVEYLQDVGNAGDLFKCL